MPSEGYYLDLTSRYSGLKSSKKSSKGCYSTYFWGWGMDKHPHGHVSKLWTVLQIHGSDPPGYCKGRLHRDLPFQTLMLGPSQKPFKPKSRTLDPEHLNPEPLCLVGARHVGHHILEEPCDVSWHPVPRRDAEKPSRWTPHPQRSHSLNSSYPP